MVASLTKHVNAVLTEHGADPLSNSQILDLIDAGSSEGGSQVGCMLLFVLHQVLQNKSGVKPKAGIVSERDSMQEALLAP